MPLRLRFVYSALVPLIVVIPLIIGYFFLFVRVAPQGRVGVAAVAGGVLILFFMTLLCAGALVGSVVAAAIRWKSPASAILGGISGAAIGLLLSFAYVAAPGIIATHERKQRKQQEEEFQRPRREVGASVSPPLGPIESVNYFDIKGVRLAPLRLRKNAHIKSIDLHRTDANDDDLRNIVHLNDLEILNLLRITNQRPQTEKS